MRELPRKMNFHVLPLQCGAKRVNRWRLANNKGKLKQLDEFHQAVSLWRKERKEHANIASELAYAAGVFDT
ncbi:hypothetical protein B4168_0990 [Anoxybacillus flavithermus]|nr:hypothetical protein B4168_0990 [Anoxybacillus flavithermus]OAO86997.1 hypothetical protein GT23_2015 [Parageobacillus thermoglucosidasius]